MKVTVIVDNIKNSDLRSEWGLCVYIEYEDKRVLLDAGSSGLFAENAEKLNIPLEMVCCPMLIMTMEMVWNSSFA